MHPELHAFSCVEYAGTSSTPAALVASVDVGVDVDRRCSLRRCTGSGVGDVAGQFRSWTRSQPGGSADANVATRAIPGRSGCQRSRRDIAHPPFAGERSKLIVIALPAANVALKDERVAIEESAARRSRQHVDLGYAKFSIRKLDPSRRYSFPKVPVIVTYMSTGTAGTSRSRIDGEDDDAESCCSTCSSSSSSDEAAAYALPPRRAYGGVRISYVPNDAVACARKRAPVSSSSPNQAQKDTEKCVVS